MKKIALLVSLVMILSFSMTYVLATESGNENDTSAILSGEDLQNTDDESGNVNDTLTDDSGEDDMLLGEDEPTDYVDSGEEFSGDDVENQGETEESSSSNGAIVGIIIAIAVVIAVVVIAVILRKK